MTDPSMPVPEPAPAPSLSKAALFSLIMGVLICVPLSGLIAVVLAVYGFFRTREPGVKGRGFAIGGGILGLANLATQIILVAGLGIWGIVHMISGGPTPQATADDFLKQLTTHTVEQFMQDNPGWSQDNVEKFHDILSSRGDFQSTTYDVATQSDSSHCHLEGTIKLSKGNVAVKSDLQKENFSWEVEKLALDAPAVPPNP